MEEKLTLEKAKQICRELWIILSTNPKQTTAFCSPKVEAFQRLGLNSSDFEHKCPLCEYAKQQSGGKTPCPEKVSLDDNLDPGYKVCQDHCLLYKTFKKTCYKLGYYSWQELLIADKASAKGKRLAKKFLERISPALS